MAEIETIHLTLTSTLADLRYSYFAQFQRHKNFIRLPIAIAFFCTIACIVGFNGNSGGAIFFACCAGLLLLVPGIWILGALFIINRTWAAAGRVEKRTDYTFSSDEIAAVSDLSKWELAWAYFERYIILPRGVFVFDKQGRPFYFSRREFGAAYGTFLSLLASRLPCTAYIDDKLPKEP